MEVLLVKKAQRKDVEAFTTLIEKHKTALYKTAKSYLKNEEDIADVMQDTVLSAYEHICDLKNAAYFKTWITRILMNHCKDLLKKQSRYETVEWLADTEAAPENDREFYELLKELPDDDRVIFVLYYGEGFRTREIAEILELNENTVKSKLRRGRKKLEQAICY